MGGAMGGQAAAASINRKRNYDDDDDSSQFYEKYLAEVERLRALVPPGARPPNSDNPKIRWTLRADGSGKWDPDPLSDDDDAGMNSGK
jgi:hypothetical protein